MSADNRLCIMQDHCGEWCVWHGSGSAEYHEPDCNAMRFSTEEEAHDWAAAEEERLGYVEYGVQRITIDEQIDSIIHTMEDLSTRLARLRRTGAQWPEREYP